MKPTKGRISIFVAAEECFKNLSMKPSEEQTSEIIKRTRNADSPRKKSALIWALGKMTEQRDPLVPGRECMTESESFRLADTLIRPFLKTLKESETDKDVLADIEQAFKELERAFEDGLSPWTPRASQNLKSCLSRINDRRRVLLDNQSIFLTLFPENISCNIVEQRGKM